MGFFDFSFWKDFASNGAATLLGVLAGIPIALAIDRWLHGRRQQEERRQSRLSAIARQRQLLELVRSALDKNKKLVEQMKAELLPQYVIFYNVDTVLLDGTSSLKYEVVEDLEFNRLLDSIRYELGHLHTKVDLQLQIEFSAFKAMQAYQERRETLVNAIRNHFPGIEREMDEALQRLSSIRDDLSNEYTRLTGATG